MDELKLYPFQDEGLQRLEGKRNCAIYWPMGSGKTIVGGVKLLQYGNKTNLVVCQKSKVQDWIDHFKQYSSKNVYDLTKSFQYRDFLTQSEDKIGVLNYDILNRRPELLRLKDIGLMFDESSMLKNPTALRTKTAFKLKAKNIILLSGTPVGGKYEELWSQCKLLGWNITKKDFYDRYIITDDRLFHGIPYPVKVVTGYKNVDDLKAKLKAFGADFMREEDILKLPDQLFITKTIETTSQHEFFGKERIIDVTTTDGEVKTLIGNTPLLYLLGLRQLAGAFNKNKLIAYLDLVESTTERLIVFYNFVEELNAMEKVTPANRPRSYVNGSCKDLTSYENCDNSITFIQYQSGAMGLNLQKARIIIYFSPTLSSELFEQSKKRTHRINQKNTCIYYMLTSGIEERIYSVLAKRENYTAQLFM